MAKLGPIEMSCDAPPYLIVQACEIVGFQRPLDVGWCRLSQFQDQEERLSAHLWNIFFNKNRPDGQCCSCGEPMPFLENYAFTFACERVVNYRLAQCQRCHKIFWEDGSLPM